MCMLVVLLVNLWMIATVSATWEIGYFEQSGSWVQWDASCYTCTNATECTSWYNKILNNSTKLWEFCAYGQFYSPQIKRWIDCEGSWYEEWGYQDECFVWPQGMKFDLALLQWVNNCTSSQVFIQDPLLKNIPVWRDPTYYIDPSSLKSIELGTLKYPFKKIGLSTMEVLNFISHSNKNVTIYIKEGSVISMTNLRNFYIDIPYFTITTYSSTENTPLRATIQINNINFSYFTPQSTQFNIISNIVLRLDDALNYSGYTSIEKSISSDTKTGIFIINRCNFNILNMNVYRNVISDKNLDIPFIIAIYEQAHTITMKNMDFHISGRILKSNQPLNLYVENVYMDFYGMMGGIYINADWNYPEASITGSIVINNVTAVNSQTRIVQLLSGILYYSGPANVTVQNTNVLIYGSLSNDKSQIEIQLNNEWLPNDGNIQTITIQNNVFSLPSNPSNDQFVKLYVDVINNYPRQIIGNFQDNQIINIESNVYPIFYCFFTASSIINLSNNTISNVSSQQGLITINTMKSVSLLNSNFYSFSNFGSNLVNFSDVQTVIVQNINWQNINATGDSTDFLFLFEIINKGIVSIDRVFMNNVNIGLQKGFYYKGLMSQISYTNMYFSNIYVGGNNRMISTGDFNSIIMKNITFINNFNQHDSDSNNHLIEFDTVNLNNATNSQISDIYVSFSRINFLMIENVVGSTTIPVYLNFTNTTFRDWNFKFKQDLITISNILTQDQFYIVFNKLTFTNITFNQGGNLINFGQQMATQIALNDLVFTAITAGSFTLKSFNLDVDYETKILIQNGYFDEVSSEAESIFILNQGANLIIKNSTFNQISCTDTGGIINAGYQNTITSIYDSSFTNNTSITASLFVIESGSAIKLYNWRIFQNFAIKIGLIDVRDDGYFEIYGSSIYQNYAMKNIIAEIISSSSYSIVDNSYLYNNVIVEKGDIVSEFNQTWRLLCFVPLSLRAFIISNSSIYNYEQETKLFEIFISNLSIQNGTTIFNQRSILSCFLTNIKLSNITIYNMNWGDKWVRGAQSIMYLTDATIYNITTYDNSYFLYAGYKSTAYITNVSYLNWQAPFLISVISSVFTNGLSITSWNSLNEWYYNLRAPASSIINSVFSNCTSNNSTTSILILGSVVSSISNVTIKNIDQNAVNIMSSNITTINGMVVDHTYGIFAKDCNIKQILNSTFTNNGRGVTAKNSISVVGGGAHFENTNFTLSFSTFYNNTSRNGAGLYIMWKLNPQWISSITNSTFSNNVAEVSGGGIMYNLYRPSFSYLTFINNSALYGPDIGSYAIKLEIENSTQNIIYLNNATSGKVSQTFKVKILDYDNQVMNLDSASKITIISNTKGALIDGKNNVVARSGIVNLNELILINTPGSQNNSFSVNLNSINMEIARAVYGKNYNFPSISVNFRFWKPGEYIFQNKWLSWSENSYSLMWNSTQCERWMENAYCEGDDIVYVDAGYWRKSTNSTLIVTWPNKDACDGGYNVTNIYPVNWGTGYKDILWSKWAKVEDNNYEKTSNFQWAKWAATFIIYVRIIGMWVAFILLILFIIYLKRKEGNERTVLMRIMANYIQIMTTTLSYNMDFPKVVSEMFSPLQVIGSGTTTVFSFDWFSSSSEFTLFTPSPTIFKMFMMSITPILLWVVISIILGTIALIVRTSFIDFKRNLIASNVIILFLIIPTLIDTGLSLFQCIEIDSDDFRVSADLNITWYSPQHILWWFMLSIPILAVWVFGTQFLILLYLIKHRRRLNSVSVKKYFHIIYIGYREERFYWEFVNTFKKFILIAYNVFLSQVSKSYKGMIAIITLIILVRVQMYLKPYKLKINNEIENSSMVAIGFTLYGGILFMKGQSQVSFIEAFAFILIIVINAVYIMFWIYLMAKTYDRHEVAKKISALLKIVLFRGDNDTVVTVTNESNQKNEDTSQRVSGIKSRLKEVKHHLNKAVKYNPLKVESATTSFRHIE